jgi:adenylate kinase family enzyme
MGKRDSPHGARIKECFDNFLYGKNCKIVDRLVDDEIVNAVVYDRIKAIESQKKSWIINGFPRTRAQAMMLQKWGVVPDRIISSTIRKKQILQRMTV